jgi:hypothetical protein
MSTTCLAAAGLATLGLVGATAAGSTPGPTIPGPTIPGPTIPGPVTPGPTISVRVTPTRVPNGGKVRVSGSLSGPTGALSRRIVELQRAPAQGGRFTKVRDAATAADGRFSFPLLRLSADARLRVAVAGSKLRSRPLEVMVGPK